MLVFDVVILTIEPELSKDKFDALLPLVSPEKRERIKKFHFFRDARNCLLGDVLARVELCKATEFVNNQLDFSVNKYGKPYLINSPYTHFNISHAGNYIACAVADEPVGIDIELIKPVDLKIAERFFTSDETAYIKAGEQMLRFYEVWTKKESRIKWEGVGLHKSLTSFSVLAADGQSKVIYHEIFKNDNAICHVCSRKKVMPSVRVLDTAAFIRNI
jgi:4'-phosphopantetheinyl transferase